MKSNEGRKPEAQPVPISFREMLPQQPVEQEPGFKIRSGPRILDPPNPSPQIQAPGSFLRSAQQALNSSAQVRGLGDLRLGTRILPSQRKNPRPLPHACTCLLIPAHY